MTVMENENKKVSNMPDNLTSFSFKELYHLFFKWK